MSILGVGWMHAVLAAVLLVACGGVSEHSGSTNGHATGGDAAGGTGGSEMRGGSPATGGSSGSGAEPGGGTSGEPSTGGSSGQPETPQLHVLGLAFGNDGFVATVEEDMPNGVDYHGAMLRSADGLVWERVVSDLELVPAQVEFGNGVFVSLASRVDVPPAALVSSDGRTWSTIELPAERVGGIAFGNDTFVAGGDSGRLRSRDGRSWEVVGPPAGDYGAGILFGAGRFVATDGWTSNAAADDWQSVDFTGDPLYRLYSLHVLDDSFVGVAAYDCCFGEEGLVFRELSSDDGLAWRLHEGESGIMPLGVVFHDASVCIAFSGTTLLSGSSCDDLQKTFVGLSGRAVVSGNGRYLVGGTSEHGPVLVTSTDGLRWTSVLAND